MFYASLVENKAPLEYINLRSLKQKYVGRGRPSKPGAGWLEAKRQPARDGVMHGCRRVVGRTLSRPLNQHAVTAYRRDAAQR